ncbi:hypothetical protein GN958_ATG01338 [Phytophthora infestans]|uniref:Uncharacterized protein n=1 Tax=Phytophthora infestans TaxID=4787 RepID=A0A8S9V906_PHYIN|nr:hypothetical protein GN958_ATG01338 [Phytophthora infestans]
MKAKFRGQSVQGAVSKPEFESKIAAFAVGFPGIAKYVSEIEPDRWAIHQQVLSKTLYGWRTTNFVESENAKALHARGRNQTLFFQYFMEKWMLTKLKRFDQARKWVEADKKVTPKAKELMSEQAEKLSLSRHITKQ